MSASVIMANDLISGDVIFLSKDTRNWVDSIDNAWVGESPQLTEQILSSVAKRNEIIGAEAIEVEHTQGQIRLIKFREQLRTLGPSVRTDLGKQAIQKAA